MSWDTNLMEEQKVAASHFGSHARLLAGPGTGKTLVLTRRIMFLIQERQVDPSQILALTFTRAAAAELRQRVAKELGDESIPKISTLHSFALRQLLRVRFQDIVNYFISKKSQDIANQIVELGCCAQ